MKTDFSDKASIVIRAMLSQPKKRWAIRDFEKGFDIGKSRTAAVLSSLRKKGFISGIPSGRLAYNVLVNKQALVEEWIKFYNFDLNEIHLYYSPQNNILPKLKNYVESRGLSDKYALTLHTGANFITNYVNIQHTYCYLTNENFKELSLDICQALDLKQLRKGGNFFLIKPYYKQGIFEGRQKIRGYNIVSNLQLYLDLFNFPQRGKEHAEYLLKIIKEKGESFV